MTTAICIHVPPLGEPFELTLPGGAQIQHLELADILQPALTPLMPMFQVVDVIAALYQCVQATVDAIGSLDPSQLASCIPELAEKISKLLGLVPQLSLPLTILVVIWNLQPRISAHSHRVPGGMHPVSEERAWSPTAYVGSGTRQSRSTRTRGAGLRSCS